MNIEQVSTIKRDWPLAKKIHLEAKTNCTLVSSVWPPFPRGCGLLPPWFPSPKNDKKFIFLFKKIFFRGNVEKAPSLRGTPPLIQLPRSILHWSWQQPYRAVSENKSLFLIPSLEGINLVSVKDVGYHTEPRGSKVYRAVYESKSLFLLPPAEGINLGGVKVKKATTNPVVLKYYRAVSARKSLSRVCSLYLVSEEGVDLGRGPVVGHHHEPVVVHVQDQVLPHHSQTWTI